MRNKTIDRLTLNAFIIALISVMSMVPQVGYLGAGNISITTIHVVVLLFALLFGIREGAVAGLTFGVLSLIRAVILPSSPIDVLFINPLVSILPRVIFGIAAGATFDALRKIQMSKSLRTALTLIALPILTLFHSLITLSTLWIVYHNNELLASFNYWILLSSIFAVNGLLEILISLALTPALAFGIYRGIKSLNFLPLKEELLMMKTQTKFKTLTSPYLEEAIEKIGALVAFDSTYDEATLDEQNPYGKKVTAALKAVEKMAMDDGFEVTNYGNKVVEILYGKGEKNVTILAHADVVPASGEWTSDPYKLRRTKTHLYARGVADDKGPFVASYMALKALRENGMITDYQVRLLVGGNEERGSDCMKYYFKTLKKPQPTFGFSPDASWPLIFGEKGITNFIVVGEIELPKIIKIEGGVATNAVIERCEIISYDPQLENFIKRNAKKYTVEKVDDKFLFVIFGKSAHGSTPEIGLNAGMIALKSVAEFSDNSLLNELVERYSPLDASGLKADAVSQIMGHNTLNVGKVLYTDKILKMDVNFRYVETVKKEVLLDKIQQNSPISLEFEQDSPLLFFDLNSQLVQTLMKSYVEETGDSKSKPLAIGGGTYAKEADNVIAFGMEKKANETKMHDADENIKIKNLKEAMAVYANAIDKLGALCK